MNVNKLNNINLFVTALSWVVFIYFFSTTPLTLYPLLLGPLAFALLLSVFTFRSILKKEKYGKYITRNNTLLIIILLIVVIAGSLVTKIGVIENGYTPSSIDFTSMFL